MATKSSSTPAPLTFDLEEPLVDKIEKCRESLGLGSTSEVVRLAISRFNYDRFKPTVAPHRQISVRLTSDMRSMLKRQSRVKSISIGELLRVAIDDLASSSANGKKPAAKKASAKKARR
jgi:Arc/MetJ-type ribon-helix-helix transcriptional regulator